MVPVQLPCGPWMVPVQFPCTLSSITNDRSHITADTKLIREKKCRLVNRFHGFQLIILFGGFHLYQCLVWLLGPLYIFSAGNMFRSDLDYSRVGFPLGFGLLWVPGFEGWQENGIDRMNHGLGFQQSVKCQLSIYLLSVLLSICRTAGDRHNNVQQANAS